MVKTLTTTAKHMPHVRAVLSRKVTKGDELILIARKDYEYILSIAHDSLELKQELAQALEEVKRGDIVGPFNTVIELKRSLEA